MSDIKPETPQEFFEEYITKLAFDAGFVPNKQWIRYVSNGLFKKYNIEEKEGEK